MTVLFAFPWTAVHHCLCTMWENLTITPGESRWKPGVRSEAVNVWAIWHEDLLSWLTWGATLAIPWDT